MISNQTLAICRKPMIGILYKVQDQIGEICFEPKRDLTRWVTTQNLCRFQINTWIGKLLHQVLSLVAKSLSIITRIKLSKEFINVKGDIYNSRP